MLVQMAKGFPVITVIVDTFNNIHFSYARRNLNSDSNPKVEKAAQKAGVALVSSFLREVLPE
jgi:hypothetical protein